MAATLSIARGPLSSSHGVGRTQCLEVVGLRPPFLAGYWPEVTLSSLRPSPVLVMWPLPSLRSARGTLPHTESSSCFESHFLRL